VRPNESTFDEQDEGLVAALIFYAQNHKAHTFVSGHPAMWVAKTATNKMHPFARWKSFIRCLVFSKRLSEPMSFCGAQIHNPNRKGGVPSLTPLTAPPNSGPVSRLTAGYLTKPTPLIADFIASLSVWPHVCVFSRIALHLLTMACC
jgi:hypothetical protein